MAMAKLVPSNRRGHLSLRCPRGAHDGFEIVEALVFDPHAIFEFAGHAAVNLRARTAVAVEPATVELIELPDVVDDRGCDP